MSGLTIICPNARRVQVKTTPMMLMRQVLEEACLKSGFEVNSHRLQTQSRKHVDASLPFRLTGLSNNATLEMTKNEAANENTVIDLAIQSGSGARHQKKVGVNVPLLEVLKEFTEFGEDLTAIVDGTVPCVVYMNKRYTGPAELASNTLASLGVSSGKCLIRHMKVKMSADELAKMDAKQKEDAEKKKTLDANFEKLKADNLERERLEKQRQEAFEKDEKARELREQEQLKAILPDPQDAQAMDTSEHSVLPQRDVLQDVPEQHPDSWSFDGPAFSRQAPQNTMRQEELNNLLERANNSLTPVGNTVESRMNAMIQALADRGRMTFAEMKARADEMMEERKNETMEVFADPCDRQAVVFKKTAKVTRSEDQVETEEFFEVGLEDVRNMQKDLRKEVRQQNQASFVSKNFVVKKNRQLKMEAYKHSVIRFNVGEHVLQACFNSGEWSYSLNTFLDSVFTMPGWKLMFTNRRVVTSKMTNLIDLELAPKSSLVASFGGQTVHAADVLQNVVEVTQEQADSISSAWLAANKPFVPFNSISDEDRKQKRPPGAPSISPSTSGPPAKSAMPKWMQTKK